MNYLGFEVYGVKFCITYDKPSHKEYLEKILPPHSLIKNINEPDHLLRFITKSPGKTSGLYWNGEMIQGFYGKDPLIFDAIESKLQYILSLVLPPEMYLMHAGAVAYKGVGIIIPGKSFAGKTTLTREFLRFGAEYYSDDCAVIDRKGFLHPYQKPLSIREGKVVGDLYRAEDLGAKIGTNPVKVGFIIFSEYEKKKKWKPENLSTGDSLMKLLENQFYPASIRLNAGEFINFYNGLINNVQVISGARSDVTEMVREILCNYFS